MTKSDNKGKLAPSLTASANIKTPPRLLEYLRTALPSTSHLLCKQPHPPVYALLFLQEGLSTLAVIQIDSIKEARPFSASIRKEVERWDLCLLFAPNYSYQLYWKHRFIAESDLNISIRGQHEQILEHFAQLKQHLDSLLPKLSIRLESRRNMHHTLSLLTYAANHLIIKTFFSSERRLFRKHLQREKLELESRMLREISPQIVAEHLIQQVITEGFLDALENRRKEADLSHDKMRMIEESNKMFGACAQAIRAVMQQIIMLNMMHGSLGGEIFPSGFSLLERILTACTPQSRQQSGIFPTPPEISNFLIEAIEYLLKEEFRREYVWMDSPLSPASNSRQLSILEPSAGYGSITFALVNRILQTYAHQQLKSTNAQLAFPQLVSAELIEASHNLTQKMLLACFPDEQIEEWVKCTLTNALSDESSIDRLLFPPQETQILWHERFLSVWNEMEPDSSSRKAFETQEIKEKLNPSSDEIPQDPILFKRRQRHHDRTVVVIGNPPYNSKGSPTGKYLADELQDFKYEPGTNDPLKEPNVQPLADDYVKFYRLALHYVQQTGQGIVALVSPHSFLTSHTFRGMRYCLLKEFDDIYIIDLHGNFRRYERDMEEHIDANIFNVRQGICICLLVRTPKHTREKRATVHHHSILGSRQAKLQQLQTVPFRRIVFAQVETYAPYYFFEPRVRGNEGAFKKGFSLEELFPVYATGIYTKRDSVAIAFTEKEMKERIGHFQKWNEAKLREKYSVNDTRDWTLEACVKDVRENGNPCYIRRIQYRPYDLRYTFYTGKGKGMIALPVSRIFRHFEQPGNVALVTSRFCGGHEWCHVFCTNTLADTGLLSARPSETGYFFPLFIAARADGTPVRPREINLNPSIIRRIEQNLGEPIKPWEFFDYIYGMLHLPAYRAAFNHQLRSEFPRIPYPIEQKHYHALAMYGTKLRVLHTHFHTLTEHEDVQFSTDSDFIIENVKRQESRVMVSKKVWIDGISDTIWNFQIGGYTPVNKYLRMRIQRTFTERDRVMLRKMVYSLEESIRIYAEMREVFPHIPFIDPNELT